MQLESRYRPPLIIRILYYKDIACLFLKEMRAHKFFKRIVPCNDIVLVEINAKYSFFFNQEIQVLTILCFCYRTDKHRVRYFHLVRSLMVQWTVCITYANVANRYLDRISSYNYIFYCLDESTLLRLQSSIQFAYVTVPHETVTPVLVLVTSPMEFVFAMYEMVGFNLILSVMF